MKKKKGEKKKTQGRNPADEETQHLDLPSKNEEEERKRKTQGWNLAIGREEER